MKYAEASSPAALAKENAAEPAVGFPKLNGAPAEAPNPPEPAPKPVVLAPEKNVPAVEDSPLVLEPKTPPLPNPTDVPLDAPGAVACAAPNKGLTAVGASVPDVETPALLLPKPVLLPNPGIAAAAGARVPKVETLPLLLPNPPNAPLAGAGAGIDAKPELPPLPNPAGTGAGAPEADTLLLPPLNPPIPPDTAGGVKPKPTLLPNPGEAEAAAGAPEVETFPLPNTGVAAAVGVPDVEKLPPILVNAPNPDAAAGEVAPKVPKGEVVVEAALEVAACDEVGGAEVPPFPVLNILSSLSNSVWDLPEQRKQRPDNGRRGG